MNGADIVFLLTLIGGFAAGEGLYRVARRALANRPSPFNRQALVERILAVAVKLTRIGGGAAIIATPMAMFLLASHGKVLDWLSFVILAGGIVLIVGLGVLAIVVFLETGASSSAGGMFVSFRLSQLFMRFRRRNLAIDDYPNYIDMLMVANTNIGRPGSIDNPQDYDVNLFGRNPDSNIGVDHDRT